MANLHNEFDTYYDKIKLTNSKKESLKQARDAIRDRVRKHFRERLEVSVPKFHAQGSYMMRTTVNPLEGEYDIDDGVYLQHLDKEDDSDWPTPATIHRWLIEAVEGHTKERPVDKKTCVRVRYAGDYHVDLPAYAQKGDEYLLAAKDGWRASDPKALTVWFLDQVKSQGEQMRRNVLYLKAWADFQKGRKGKMVNGLILTILVSRHYHSSERDDISLAETVKAIQTAVENDFEVFNPIDGAEKLTDRLTDGQKLRFQEAIAELAEQAKKAVDTDDKEEAARIWRRQLGDRFPKVEKEKSENHKKQHVAGLVAGCIANNPPKPWSYHR